MDPSIMKFLEDDEDESMHSGADVEAFTAALNRDIEGDNSTSQSTDADSTILSQGSNPTSSQLFSQWQSSSQEESVSCQNQRDEGKNLQPEEQNLSETDTMRHVSAADTQQQICSSQENKQLHLQHNQSHDNLQQQQPEQNRPQMQVSEHNRIHFPEQDKMQNLDSQNQNSKLQKIHNPQTADHANNTGGRAKQVPFGLLLPIIMPHLDKDRAMQLQTLYNKLRKNEINKDGFVRHMRNVVGDQMLKQAISKMHLQEKFRAQAARNSQTGPDQYRLQSQASSQQQHLKMPSSSASQLTDSHSFAQLNQKDLRPHAGPPFVPTSMLKPQTDSGFPTLENSAQKPRDAEHQSDLHGIPGNQLSSANMTSVNQEMQGLNKQQQQNLHLPQTSFPMYGTTVGTYNSHAYSGPASGAASSIKIQAQDSQMRQVPLHQGMGSTNLAATQPMNMTGVPKYEMQNSSSETKRLQGGSHSHLAKSLALHQNPVTWQSSINKEQKSNASTSSLTFPKQEPSDQSAEQQHKSLISDPPGSSSFGAGQIDQVNTAPPSALKDESLENQSARMAFSMATMPTSTASSSMTIHSDHAMQIRSQISSATTPIGVGTNARTPPKKPTVGQKKPLEALGTPSPIKKQKVSGAFLDQSIEQLNDVTAVSGVNLREEEEQLLSGPKEESRVSEASRRAVQEEEERLILQKVPLQKKLAQIMSKCRIKNISNDVERCLSLSVEERMRGLIHNLIRLSKQRVDVEKPRHRTLFTSDVRRQILIMNRKAKEEWERRQSEEAEKLRKLNEAEGNTGVDGEKDKDESRTKAIKANKEEDDKMRTTAANVAARAAVGGDDMLSKWQLMAEQARQKREGGIDMSSDSQPDKDVSHKPLASGRTLSDNQEAENKGSSAVAAASGALRKFGRSQFVVPQAKVARSISVKDVIAALEREPQMSKSALLYRLYERLHPDSIAD